MEINVLSFFTDDVDAYELSGSIAEHGEDAGRVTWQNSLEQASEKPLLTTSEQIEAARDWFGEFGAWDDEERAAWTDDDVNALFYQELSSDLRSAEGFDTHEAWEHDCREGTCSGGRVYLQDIVWNGKKFVMGKNPYAEFYIGP